MGQPPIYDFIVAGAGASGALLASRLAHTPATPSVLLLEAGGSNASFSNLSAAERFNVAFAPDSPLNYSYRTIPQHQLSSQQIDYSRGKGLGGSTAINFCGWVVGPKDDYDEWARSVRDDSFNWNNASRCLDNITTLHTEIPDPRLTRHVAAEQRNEVDKTMRGPIHLTYGSSWLPDLEDIFLAAEQAGLSLNQDVNSGNPLGLGIGTVCIHEGQRITSSTAYLTSPPSNLTILPNSLVSRVIFSSKRALGVETTDGRVFHALKEVVVSGGAINTPQILMLSGLGPKKDLERLGIEVVQDLPQMGMNLQDHCFSSAGIVVKRNREAIEAGELQSPTPMGWFKLDAVFASPEYAALDDSTKEILVRETVPSIEIATHTPPALASYTPSPNNAANGVSFLGIICLVMNPQSRGTVKLASMDPKAAPYIDPNFLGHPFDRRVLIEGLRQTMQVLSSPVYANNTIEKIQPEDDTDEAIWKHIKRNTHSSWHMACTARMGRDAETACVDSDFKVFKVQALRIVDMSVCPFVPNNHTQSTAYVLGKIAAEKLIKEYNLLTSAKQLASML